MGSSVIVDGPYYHGLVVPGSTSRPGGRAGVVGGPQGFPGAAKNRSSAIAAN